VTIIYKKKVLTYVSYMAVINSNKLEGLKFRNERVK